MTIRRGLMIFLVLSVLVAIYILLSSADAESLRILLSADIRGIVISFVLVFLAWSFDALRLCAVAKAAREKIFFKTAIILTWLHYFGCAVTPMQTGGGPFQVYVLYRGNIPVGKGVIIALTRTMFTMFLLGLSVIITVMVEPGFVRQHVLLQGFFLYVALFVIFSWGLFILSFACPTLIKHWGAGITLILRRFGIVRQYSVIRYIRRIYHEIDNYNVNFRRFFGSGLPNFLKAFFYSCLHLISLFSVLPVLAWSMGFPIPYLQAFMAQSVFLFILYFVPTPGASGVAEGGGAALFSLLLPWNMAGLMAILWRFFTEYLAIIMGAAVAVRMLGWGLSENIFKKGDENY